MGHIENKLNTPLWLHLQITTLLFPSQNVGGQHVDVNMESVTRLLNDIRSRNSPDDPEPILLGWIHDHHHLDDEPTIDYDCWFQYNFQKENPFY